MDKMYSNEFEQEYEELGLLREDKPSKIKDKYPIDVILEKYKYTQLRYWEEWG